MPMIELPQDKINALLAKPTTEQLRAKQIKERQQARINGGKPTFVDQRVWDVHGRHIELVKTHDVLRSKYVTNIYPEKAECYLTFCPSLTYNMIEGKPCCLLHMPIALLQIIERLEGEVTTNV